MNAGASLGISQDRCQLFNDEVVGVKDELGPPKTYFAIFALFYSSFIDDLLEINKLGHDFFRLVGLGFLLDLSLKTFSGAGLFRVLCSLGMLKTKNYD